MSKERSLKTKLSVTIGISVLVTVALISLLANFFINKQFVEYIEKQQEQQVQSIVDNISREYADSSTSLSPRRGHGMMMNSSNWDINNLNIIGTNALSEGYIIEVYDENDQSVWNAYQQESEHCKKMMTDINDRMESYNPGNVTGEFKTSQHPVLSTLGADVGKVDISYYGPYFLNESEFQFLDALNTVLYSVGGAALIIAVFVGMFMARKMTQPLLTTSQVAKQMAEGDYHVRLTNPTTTTELNQLMVSINHLAESLESQEKLRKNLTADVAHELRTPLTTMSTHIEAMIEGVWEPTTERLTSCYDELERITFIVKDLENLAKVEQDNLQLNKKHLSLKDMVETSLNNYSFETAEKNLTVKTLGTEGKVFVDPDRFYQVVNNLISNAVKYTENGDSITATISETLEYTKLEVEDTGIGIAKESLPYVFQRFYRVDKSRTRSTGGSGIGMAVVHSVVTAHGGEVSVSSGLGQGSIFTVIIPKKEI